MLLVCVVVLSWAVELVEAVLRELHELLGRSVGGDEVLCIYIYIYIHIYIYTHTHTYIYIYIYICICICVPMYTYIYIYTYNEVLELDVLLLALLGRLGHRLVEVLDALLERRDLLAWQQ